MIAPDTHDPEPTVLDCEHEWEYCAVAGRGTDFICQKCRVFLTENPHLRGTGKVVVPGPYEMAGPYGQWVTEPYTRRREPSRRRVALSIAVPVLVVALYYFSIWAGWWK